MPFVVGVINKTAEVGWMGTAVELPLSYADGMIGCMPVFETKEKAESFADGAYEILEVVTTPPNSAISLKGPPRNAAETRKPGKAALSASKPGDGMEARL